MLSEHLRVIIIIIIFFLTLGTYDPEGDEKLRKLIYNLGYDHQSVRQLLLLLLVFLSIRYLDTVGHVMGSASDLQ